MPLTKLYEKATTIISRVEHIETINNMGFVLDDTTTLTIYKDRSLTETWELVDTITIKPFSVPIEQIGIALSSNQTTLLLLIHLPITPDNKYKVVTKYYKLTDDSATEEGKTSVYETTKGIDAYKIDTFKWLYKPKQSLLEKIKSLFKF